MYRILRPNGQWITESLAPGGLRFDDLKAAVKYAQQFAQITQDHGEFLAYEGDQDTPSCRTRMEHLVEDE